MESINELKIKCQHSYHGWSQQPWLFLQIRKISIYVTWLLLKTRLSPNGISLLAIVAGLMSSIAYATSFLFLGLLMLQISIILDFSDGEVSRYRNQKSKEGSYLDKIYIYLVHPSLFAGITLYEYNFTNSYVILVSGIVCIICTFLFSMAVEYGRQVVVWRHFIKFIFSLNIDEINFIVNEQQGSSFNSFSSSSDKNIYSRNLYSQLISNIQILNFQRVLSFWDFPYVFVVMSAVCILEILSKSGFLKFYSISPIDLYILFYAFTYPAIIFMIIFKNVKLRIIERDYQLLVDEFMELIRKNSISPFIK